MYYMHFLLHPPPGQGRWKPRLFKGCHRSSRSPVQRTLPTTATNVRPSHTGSAFLRLSIIPRPQQSPFLRGLNAQPHTFRSLTHISIATHSSTYGALASPEGSRAGAELGDALDGCCA